MSLSKLYTKTGLEWLSNKVSVYTLWNKEPMRPALFHVRSKLYKSIYIYSLVQNHNTLSDSACGEA